MGPSLLYVWICKSGTGGRCPWQPVAVRGAARLRGRIWNPPLRALCSKVFLRSYCSTPPLKRKIKFFFKLCRLFQHRRRFFRWRAGLLSGAHFLPERGGGGWNPRHSFLQAVLLSAAQFAGQPLLYRLLFCAQFRGGGVGIPRTVCGGRGCYRQHNFCAVRSAGQKIPVVIGRTIPTFFCGRQVVIHSTICAVWKIDYCYRQHNSDFGRLSKSV